MSDPSSPNYPLVQISLDLTNLADALEMAEIAVSAGVDWLEAGTPLLLYLQESGSGIPGVPEPGFSNISNEEFSLFVQDTWKPSAKLTVNYGLRWDAQLMPETVDPGTTAYAQFIGDPGFPSDGTIPDQWGQFQPRLGIAWDANGDGRSVLRASAGLYYARQNMLSQVGSVTANGLQQQTTVRGLFTGLVPGVLPMPVWPNVVDTVPVVGGQFPLFTGVRVFDKDYQNPRIFQANAAYERELAPDWSGYVDVTFAQARHLTRFIPGHPAVIVRNMPGAGTLNAANHIANVAPKDGTTIGLIARGMAIEPLLGGQGVRFEPLKLNWIGSTSPEVSVIAVRSDIGVKTLDDVKTREVVVAGPAPGTGATAEDAGPGPKPESKAVTEKTPTPRATTFVPMPESKPGDES